MTNSDQSTAIYTDKKNYLKKSKNLRTMNLMRDSTVEANTAFLMRWQKTIKKRACSAETCTGKKNVFRNTMPWGKENLETP